MDDYDLIINRALQMVAAAARAPEAHKERVLRNAKQMIDKAAQKRYTGGVITNTAQAPPGEPPPKPNRAAGSRPPLLVKRGKTNESR